MKINLFIIILCVFFSFSYGQVPNLSEDVNHYLKNENRYKRQAGRVVKRSFKRNERIGSLRFMKAKYHDYIVVPTFNIQGDFIDYKSDSFLLSLQLIKVFYLKK